MIVTGWTYPGDTTTEIIDVIDGETCTDLADFPMEIGYSVGANLQGTPIVCGGWINGNGDSDNCYQFLDDAWQEFATMNRARDFAAGIIYDKKFHIFGGNDGSAKKSTEILSADGVVIDGPVLPTGVSFHTITSINATLSILSGGGQYDANADISYSLDQTWYYNHATQEFKPGPTLLEKRNLHTSATIIDKITKANIPVISGGVKKAGDSSNSYVILDSTEFLIHGEWQAGELLTKKKYCWFCLPRKRHSYLFFLFLMLGPPMPKRATRHAMVEIQGDLFVFGGLDKPNSRQTAIHKLECSSNNCSWSTINQQMQAAKRDVVAIAVPNWFCKTTATTTSTTTLLTTTTTRTITTTTTGTTTTSTTSTTTTNEISSKKISTSLTLLYFGTNLNITFTALTE